MKQPLSLRDYRTRIQLDEPRRLEINKAWPTILAALLPKLGVAKSHEENTASQLFKLHGVLATIDPYELTDDLMDEVEVVAMGARGQYRLTRAIDLPSISQNFDTGFPAAEKTALWVGDITKLEVDAIVNAANSELLGCRIPNHACIDNAIHSAAGPRLRDDCAIIMAQQKTLEPTGNAKITRAHALPAKFVLHTVGPQLVHGSMPTEHQRTQLHNAYVSCLNLAAEVEQIRTIAFCAISTGLFGFPKRDAAEIALTAVAGWHAEHPGRFDRILFNLFTDADALVYEKLVQSW